MESIKNYDADKTAERPEQSDADAEYDAHCDDGDELFDDENFEENT